MTNLHSFMCFGQVALTLYPRKKSTEMIGGLFGGCTQ